MSNSIKLTGTSGSGVLSFTGLDADKPNLPTKSDPTYGSELRTGATYFAVDTKNLYFYEETTDAWY